MAVYEIDGKKPVFEGDYYIAPSATVIGDVVLGDKVIILHGAVVRGDYGRVEIGAGSAVEDNAMIHARPGEVCKLGKRVTVGHLVMIHNATIHDSAVLGMSSVVSDYSEIGEWAVVAEGAVVKSKTIVPPKGLAVGVPATIKENFIKDAYMAQWNIFKDKYNELVGTYNDTMKKIE